MSETRILKNTIPEHHIGVRLKDRFATGYAFTFDEVKKKDLYFQGQAYLHVLKADTDQILFEFRTFTYFKCDKRIQDEGFYELVYSFVLTTIDEFNREYKKLKSSLTFNKTYTPIPTLEQTKTPIRQAYLILKFNNPPNPN